MYILHYVTITSQGQITIPAEIRRELGLYAQKKAIVTLEQNQIVVKPVRDILELEGVFKTNKKIPYKKIREAFGDYLAKRHLKSLK